MLDRLHREIGCSHANTNSSQVVMSGSASAGLLSGAVADWVVGDPRRWHPVAGFGAVAAALERRWWRPSRSAGVAYVGVPGWVATGALFDRLVDSAISLPRAHTLPARLSDPATGEMPVGATGHGSVLRWFGAIVLDGIWGIGESSG
jgi:hypothetical protein